MNRRGYALEQQPNSVSRFWVWTGISLFVATLLLFALSPLIVDQMLKSLTRSEIEWKHKYMSEKVMDVAQKRSKGIHFYDIPKADEFLARIPPLNGLEFVSFDSTAISPTGVKALAIQPNLKAIEFSGADDEIVEAVATLPHLESVDIYWAHISDESVKRLVLMPTIRSLLLSYYCDDRFGPAKMTDVALDALASNANLKELWLRGDWFSDEAVERLRQALPDCKIDVRSEKPAPPSEPVSVPVD